MQLAVHAQLIPDIKLISSVRHTDGRGYFSETFSRSDFAAHGIPYDFIQDNQSCSVQAGTVRGLHFQHPPFEQAKLIRVLQGRILDVAVDLRRNSPTFGRYVAVELDDQANEQLLVPAGFAHGFCTLVPDTVVFYKVDNIYSAQHEDGINWADPQLGIPWPVAASAATISDKDRRLPMLAALSSEFA